MFMKNYKLHVYFRHYIKDDDTLQRYKKIVNRVNRATKLTDFNFNILVNYDPSMSQKMKDAISDISKKLIESDVEFSVRIGHGAGVALFDTMEEILSNMSMDRGDFLITVIDGDSYPIDDVKFLRQVRKLADSVHENGSILGLAQRSKVILAEGQMEIYREINELFFALAMKGNLPVKKSRELSIPASYAELGDPVPGFYCINMTHPKTMQLFEQLEQDMKSADMTHYTGDHYLVLAASQFGTIQTEIVPLEGNPPGSFSFDSIVQMSHEIGKTSLRKAYLQTVKSEENLKTLEKFYGRKEIEKVQETILKAMLKR